jgi:lysophospholipase L1-like esterase
MVAIILAETFFRIGGFILIQKKAGLKGEEKSHYRILCLGDSSTYGLGASDIDKFSYPMQLQKILEEKSPGKIFRVINYGIPGLNSSQLLNRIRNIVSEYEPDVVIIMIGINDPWNLEESNILKFYKESPFDKIILQFELILNRIRLFQFLKLVFISGELGEPRNVPFSDRTRSKGFTLSSRDSRKSQALYSALNENILEMVRIANDYRIKIIFMKYHNIGWGSPEKIIYETYTRLKVPIVDNEAIFNKATKMGMNVRGYDGWHPNNFGYSLIAKNVYNTMITAKIIDGEPVGIFSSGIQ